MTIKKSLLAVATASAVAVASAGVANASEPTTGNDWGTPASSVDLSSEAGTIFGSASKPGGDADLIGTYRALINIALAGGAVAGSIMVLPSIYEATKAFQQYVDDFTGDTQAFINSFTN